MINYFLYPFIFVIMLNVFFIPFLRKIKCGQSIRKEGPKEHLKKSGTPTMGGIFIVISVTLFIIIFGYLNNLVFESLIFVYPGIAFGLIGIIDDYLKVVKKDNYGLSPKMKLLLQILFSILYIVLFNNYLITKINIFGYIIDLGYLYYLFIIMFFVSVTNSYNFCDGLDGLASGIALIILSSLLFVCKKEIEEVYLLVIISSVLGFLCYNYHPAKVFMGDSGSLAIGAYIANIFILLKMEVLIVIFGLVLVIEILSVVLQVVYFKLTKGKRIFLMTPLHHHFELLGMSEIDVDILFWLFTIISCLFGLAFST